MANDDSGLEERIAALERDLAEVSEQQGVTAELLRTIGGSTFDLGPVFDKVLRNAVTLCRARGGHIWRFDGTHYRAVRRVGGSVEYHRLVEGLMLRPGTESLVGKVALERRAVQLPDVLVDPDYSLTQLQRVARFRTILGVPMMREGIPVAVIILWRREVDPFSERQIELVSTFAAQGAIAIANAELLKELGDKNRELEVASRHKSEFLAHMSHELRTPLNAVIGFSEVLLERMFGDLNDKQEEYLRDILDSGRHLLDLINDVLDVSKVEAGEMKLELANVSPVDVLEDSLRLVREQAGKRGLTLSVEVDPDVPAVTGDERRIKQVVANLLSNAVKFTPDGGSVDVRARVVDDAVCVSVADTGVGIAPDDQEAIFGAFQQVAGGPKPTPEGTGLGLTLSRQIVALHGGRMWIESEVGVGSTFTFTLPAAPAPPVPREVAGDAAPTAEHAQPTALLVEDDEHSIDLLSLHLRDAGFDVAVARDGEAGLELARQLRPDGIVLDILLPKLDGWEFLARTKADSDLKEIPIIIVSMVDERGKGIALGAADYLVKPVGRNELLAALGRVTNLPSPARVLAIDDDPMAIELIEAVLEPAGYEVMTARSGSEGVALAQAQGPDIVLLDLVMPEVDGFMVVDQLRSDPATSDIPIVVLTSKTLTAADKERLKGRIAYVAQKAQLSREELIALMARFAAAKAR